MKKSTEEKGQIQIAFRRDGSEERRTFGNLEETADWNAAS